MRIGLIVAPTTLPDLRPAPGTLDSDLVRARLPQADVGMEVVEVDPTTDVAEQLDRFFEEHPRGLEALLFYASTFVALAPDGEVFLCLDPTNPDVGDSLRDVAAAMRDRFAGPLLFVLDCRHAPDEEDAFRSATIASAIRSAVDPAGTGIELLVAAQPTPPVFEDAASAFTRAFLAELDEADPSRRTLASNLYRRIHSSERLLGVVPCFAHTNGREPFVLISGDGSGRVASMPDRGEMFDSRVGDSWTTADSFAGVESQRGVDSRRSVESRRSLVDRLEISGAGEPAGGRREVHEEAAHEAHEEHDGAHEEHESAGHEEHEAAGREEREEAAHEGHEGDDADAHDGDEDAHEADDADAHDGDEDAHEADEGAEDEDAHDGDAHDGDEDAAHVEHEDEAPAAARGGAKELDTAALERAAEAVQGHGEIADETSVDVVLDEPPLRQAGILPPGTEPAPLIPPPPPAPVLRPSSAPARTGNADRAVAVASVVIADRPAAPDPSALPKIVISDRPPPPRSSEPARPAVEPARPGTEPPREKPATEPPPAAKLASQPPPAAKLASEPPRAKPATEPPPAAKLASQPPPAESRAGESVKPPAAAESPAAEPEPPPPEPEPEPEPPKEPTYADHVAQGDALASRDAEAALAEYKKALLLVTPAQKEERADVYVRIGQVKLLQDKRREAISNFEKATQLSPNHLGALEEIAKLSVEERDFRGVAATEEKILATIAEPERRFARLVEFGDRWASVAYDTDRARSAFQRAREIRPDDLDVLARLLRIAEASGAANEALALRVEIADKTPDGRARAERYAALGSHALSEQHDEDAALRFFEKALDADPTAMEPLATSATILAERQEWSELEAAYRRMLARTDRIPEASIRTRVRFELNLRLALLFRDHLEDPEAALRALEKALSDRPGDVTTRQTAVALARELSRWDTARGHLQTLARLDPMVVQTYHDLFDVFQKLKRPDQAWLAASVTAQLGHAEQRERFIYDEGKTDGPPKPTRAIGLDGWDLLRDAERDHAVEDVLEAITKAAIEAKLESLRDAGRLPTLDPAAKQDPKKSTVSIVRSFAWASHLLGVPMPGVYLRDDAQVGLAAVIAEEPAVIAGAGVLRGKSLTELAFAAGRHLGYHVGSHRLLLYYPVIDDLAVCFLAAVRTVMPSASVPAKMEKAVESMEGRMEPLLDGKARAALERAVLAFDAAGSRADLTRWVAAVERCCTRAGYLLSNDLRTAATSLAAEGSGVLTVEQKMVDLLWFTVSEPFHELRDALGIAIEP